MDLCEYLYLIGKHDDYSSSTSSSSENSDDNSGDSSADSDEEASLSDGYIEHDDMAEASDVEDQLSDSSAERMV